MPEDDLPPGPESCATCARYLHHGERHEHGRWYCGVKGYGFRTNRCLRHWSQHPFVSEVLRAVGWASSEGGGFAQAYGADPPAKLVEAVAFYRSERAAVKSQQWAEERAARKAESEIGKHRR